MTQVSFNFEKRVEFVGFFQMNAFFFNIKKLLNLVKMLFLVKFRKNFKNCFTQNNFSIYKNVVKTILVHTNPYSCKMFKFQDEQINNKFIYYSIIEQYLDSFFVGCKYYLNYFQIL